MHSVCGPRPKTGTLSASEGTLGYPSKTPQSARSHREMDTRIFLPPQHVPQMGPTGPTSPVGPMGHIPGRFQRVSHTQLPVPQTPQTPQSTSSNSSMRPQGPQGPPAWHLQSHLPEHVPSSATSESSATVSKACAKGSGKLQHELEAVGYAPTFEQCCEQSAFGRRAAVVEHPLPAAAPVSYSQDLRN